MNFIYWSQLSFISPSSFVSTNLSFAVSGLTFLLVSSYLDKAWSERSNCGNALTFCAENPLDWLNLVIENKFVLDLENPLEFSKTL